MAVLALFPALSACSATPPSALSLSPAATSAGSGSPSPSSMPLPGDAGPLAGLRWPAPRLAPGTLLHDDTKHLSAVPQGGGQPRILWSHPAADVYRVAAGPDGRELALAVGNKSNGVDSTILYLLGADGSVLTVRETAPFWSVASMIFVPAPTHPKGPIRLYWTESSSGGTGNTGTSTFPMRVMTYDGSSVQRVDVPLLWSQSPRYLNAYPGNSTSSLMIFRLQDIPTRFEVLRNSDHISGATLSSPTTWGSWQTITDTGLDTQVAWLSPDDYVVGYGDSPHVESIIPSYALKMFRVGCEWAGSHTFWSGRSLDAGVAGAAWTMLSPDPTHVLVLGRDAASGPTPWLSVDVNTGSITATAAMWTPEGAWTVVRSAEKPTSGHPSCSGVKWSWP